MNRPARAVAVSFVLLLPAPTLAQAAGAAAYEKGIEHYTAADYKQAQQAFEQAVEADPGNADYHLWLGRAYGRRAETNSGLKMLASIGLARKTRACFERAAALDGENLGALESLFRYYIEAPAMVGGGASKALAVAQQIEAVNPAAGARAWAVYREAQKNFDQAEAALEKARELEPAAVGHLLAHASFLARRGRHEQADALFADALRREPDNPSAWLARAKSLIRGKRKPRYGEARDLLRRYLETPLAEPDAEPYANVRKLLKEI